MQAIVLAGGYATRLWPITKHRPKMFLPVGDTVIIDRIFEELESDERIDEVYVSTNERFAGAFEEHLAESDFTKPQLSVEDTSGESEKFGVIGALAQLVEREGIDDDLLVIAGDNLISFSISDFVNEFEAREAPTIAAYDVGSRKRATSFGILELDGDRVVDFEEKPDDPPSTLASIACYAFPADAIAFEEYLAGDNNPDEPGWFVQWLQAKRPVYAYTFDDAWFDIGTAEGYLETVAWALNGDTAIEPDATVENSEIGDDVHVMGGATIRNATVDRSVIFPDATIENATVTDSIVDEDAHIAGTDLAGALVGAHTKLPDDAD
ncbi:sugar phosphate nucleotidyltransferase [Halococcus salifodinae]|uniref:Sugar nucleotidyltransferase n=1 Tax=Halococcus salifodinae DSM 8989 TaxID=1227456 RepID=M0MU70_9EURY|nr:NDP-sugar synthase [Halococcus salifodinae]EMA49287.1 sugar nucleotidyltransferase [Halococcus salifodinae DSM 8989]